MYMLPENLAMETLTPNSYMGMLTDGSLTGVSGSTCSDRANWLSRRDGTGLYGMRDRDHMSMQCAIKGGLLGVLHCIQLYNQGIYITVRLS